MTETIIPPNKSPSSPSKSKEKEEPSSPSKSKGKQLAQESPKLPEIQPSLTSVLLGDNWDEVSEEDIDFIPEDEDEDMTTDESDIEQPEEQEPVAGSSTGKTSQDIDQGIEEEVVGLFEDNEEFNNGDDIIEEGLRSGKNRNKVYNAAPKRGVVEIPEVEGQVKKPKLW